GGDKGRAGGGGGEAAAAVAAFPRGYVRGGGRRDSASHHVPTQPRAARPRTRRRGQARSDRAQGDGRHRTVDRAGQRHAVAGRGRTAHAVLRAGRARLRAAHRDGWPRSDRQRGGAVAIDPRLQLWRSSPLERTGADLGGAELGVADVGVGDRYSVSRKSAPNRAGDMAVTTDNEERQKASARSLTTIVDFAVGSHGRAVAVLLVVALLGFLPGFFSVPP